MSGDRLVIGVGSDHRGDDAVGLETVRRITCVETAEVSDCSDLIEHWDGRDEVVVVDAMVSGSDPGCVRRFDAIATALPQSGFASTHAFDLSAAVAISRALGRLPRSLIVYGIEAADTSPGSPLSPAVRDAMESVVDDLEADG